MYECLFRKRDDVFLYIIVIVYREKLLELIRCTRFQNFATTTAPLENSLFSRNPDYLQLDVKSVEFQDTYTRFLVTNHNTHNYDLFFIPEFSQNYMLNRPINIFMSYGNNLNVHDLFQ